MSITPDAAWPPHIVAARNISQHADTTIHDDAEAQRRGFRGGLVAGRVLFSHLLHPLVAHRGLAVLHACRLSVRFQKPAYEGDRITVTRTDDGGPAVTLLAANDAGVTLASLTADWPRPFPAPDTRATQAPPPHDGHRILADWASFSAGLPLPEWRWRPDSADNIAWCESIGETLSAFHEGTPLPLHPGLIPTATTEMLHANLRIGGWVHSSSTFHIHRLPRVGVDLELRATLEEKFERKGRRFGKVYVAVLADGAVAVEELRTALITEPKPDAEV